MIPFPELQSGDRVLVRSLTGGWQHATFKNRAPQGMAVIKLDYGATMTVRAEHLKVMPAPKTLLEAVQEVQSKYETDRKSKEKHDGHCKHHIQFRRTDDVAARSK